NLTLVVLPPASLVVLDLAGLDGVAAAVVVLVGLGLGVVLVRPPRPVGVVQMAREVVPAVRSLEGPATVPLDPARRRLGIAYRASWTAPLAIVLLFVAHWGVVTAYLPQRAEAAGANIGLFFAADGVSVLLMRVPAGWLSDRLSGLPLVLAGIAITAVGVALLLLPPVTWLLVVAGLLTGVGAALIVTPLLLELTRRSTDADRGSAFALFSAGFAAAIALGSIGAAPLVAVAGFEVAIGVAMVGLALAAGVALGDGGLRVGRRQVRG
ncbi:MAG TPA: MFS transporter, partial [Candidatus Binatia bacterium]|nr:MFS transporter [Candidatus Binatia bacterium]